MTRADEKLWEMVLRWKPVYACVKCEFFAVDAKGAKCPVCVFREYANRSLHHESGYVITNKGKTNG